VGGGFGAELVGLAVGLADVPGCPLFALFDVLHAATNNAMVPVTAKVASRVIRGLNGVVGINVSPIAGLPVQAGIPRGDRSRNQQ
jgi:hypothetical protein